MSGEDPTSEETEALRYYADLVRPLYSGRRFILIGGPVVGLLGMAQQLRTLGADRPFLLGSIVGTGALPKPEEAEWYSLEVRGENVIEAMRTYEARLSNLPDETRAALDRYDPDRSALVLGLIVLGDVHEVAGRRRYAGELPAWRVFEDKVETDQLWDAIGIRRAPSEIVPVGGRAFRAAAARLDAGQGTVWAGDAREGTNGGAVYLRWVRTEQDAVDAERFFDAHCDRIRVMPFLEGIPCSIHGAVFTDAVAAFRPVEMITLRPRGKNRLLYAGTATFWDPAPADREEMRTIARTTGEALRERVGYRGPFTVDGVLTENGFLPTELNARFGAGLGVLGRSVPSLPLTPVLLAAQAGEPLDFRPEMLEEVVVRAADRNRGGAGYTTVSRRWDSTETRPLRDENGRYRIARTEEKPDAILLTGPGDVGGFVMFGPDPARTPVGPPLAPRVVKAFAFADDKLGTDIGTVDAARPAR
jgi:hypothetical protein